MARSTTLNMTEGRLSRQIITFSLPLMFTNLLQMLFSMGDLAVGGRFRAPPPWARSARPRRSSSCSRAF